MTYLLLDVLFLAPLAVWAYLWRKRVSWRAIGWSFVVLAGLTIVFDSLIISADIVRYHADALVGWSIGIVPIEDMAYVVMACLLTALVWEATGERR